MLVDTTVSGLKSKNNATNLLRLIAVKTNNNQCFIEFHVFVYNILEFHQTNTFPLLIAPGLCDCIISVCCVLLSVGVRVERLHRSGGPGGSDGAGAAADPSAGPAECQGGQCQGRQPTRHKDTGVANLSKRLKLYRALSK
jgi:hypothetical protein